MRRFWSKVDTSAGPDACWPWQGHLRGRHRNYGGYRFGGRNVYAHRFALDITSGVPLPPTIIVLHACDNPLCCNPAHLSAGGHGRNLREAYARGRRVPANQHTKRRQLRQSATIDAAT